MIVGNGAIARSLRRWRGTVGTLVQCGSASCTVAFTVWTVDFGLDGVALKLTVDLWASAPLESQPLQFGIAQSLRWLEYGLNGLARICESMIILFFGLAAASRQAGHRWVGLAGAAAGAAGIAAMATGFSPLVGLPGWGAFLLGAVWTVSVSILLWRGRLAGSTVSTSRAR